MTQVLKLLILRNLWYSFVSFLSAQRGIRRSIGLLHQIAVMCW